MLPAISSATSALAAEQLRAAAAAHDIANAATPGHRVQPVSLEGSESGGVRARQEGPSPQQGAIRHTGRPLDLAIYGNGFFQVRTADGQVALTRTGTFRTDGTGRIVTAGGVGLVPPISVPPLSMQLTVTPDGIVSANGVVYGRIQLVDVPAPERLQAVGGGLFRPTVGSGGPTPSTTSQIHQGALEESTTDLAVAAVDLRTARHAVAADARSLEAQDELARTLLNL